MKWSRTRSAKFLAVGAAAALLLAACGDGDEEPGGGESTAPEENDEPVTITITTFGTFGYDDLYAEYEELHPNVTIEATNIDTGGNARTDTFTKIAAGSGLTDIVALEEGWLGAIMEVSDNFVDLRDYGVEDRKSDWLEWKYDQGTDQASGRVIGMGTDIGPEGICYRPDLFAEAGLPSERGEVAEYLEGDWEHFFDVGREYNEATGKAWYDHSGFIWNGIVNQMDEGYYTADGELNVEDNAELREAFDLVAKAVADGLSASQAAWDWNGGQSFVDGTFATFVCPGWMLGVVEGQVQTGAEAASVDPESVVWDFADVFPGGAANWGGSFLTVSEASEHKAEAAALASWLTEPEQQVAAYKAAGVFPSTTEAAQTLADEAEPRATFNDAPAGAILASRAQGIQAQFKGPDDSVIQENVFGPALQALDQGTADGDAAWDQAITLLNELVVNN